MIVNFVLLFYTYLPLFHVVLHSDAFAVYSVNRANLRLNQTPFGQNLVC